MVSTGRGKNFLVLKILIKSVKVMVFFLFIGGNGLSFSSFLVILSFLFSSVF